MSWECKVQRVVSVEPLPNSDRLDLVTVANWPLVSQRGLWQPNMLATYVMADSLVPDNILEATGLIGKLSGPRKNRVKPIRLRGTVSIGILLPAPDGAAEGDDVAEQLGIIKYEQEIPPQFRGVQKVHPPGWEKYDIDNVRSYAGWLIEGEEVCITEKIHGTQVKYSLINREFGVHSKNCSLERDDNNIYWKVAIKYGIEEKMRDATLGLALSDIDSSFWLYGEIYGPVQDLKYGLKEPTLAIFDMKLSRSNGIYLDYDKFLEIAKRLELLTVPELYRGPFSQGILKSCTDGTNVAGIPGSHCREGCVIKPVAERLAGKNYSRVILKSVSDAYHFRQAKNGEILTDFN